VTKYFAPSWRPARCAVARSYIEPPCWRISSASASCSLRATTRTDPLFTSDVSIDDSTVTSESSMRWVVRFSIGQIAIVGSGFVPSTSPFQKRDFESESMFSETR